MRSPFTGMDPFLEGQEWEDFHTRFNTVLADLLSPRIEPAYVVRVERRVYLEGPGEEHEQWRRADAAIVATDVGDLPLAVPASATALAPAECIVPMPTERRETYLVVRDREDMEVITVIETLSPANKRSGDGRREYLKKREEVLASQAHLVELDLLRGGERMPMNSPLPVGDFYAIVSRRYRRPRAAVYAWTLRDRLPEIAIPLKKGDDDAPLDLQSAFETVCARARYDLSLNYKAELFPPPDATTAEWIQARLATD
ncbi:MAG: DUF4058 family protein [Planctomycetes bacterium]|nr:DUF4058 family protein [Planctomycetota bacterium]